MPLRRPETTSVRTGSAARTVVVGAAGVPTRAEARPRSMSTVHVARPPAVNSIVAVVSASSGE